MISTSSGTFNCWEKHTKDAFIREEQVRAESCLRSGCPPHLDNFMAVSQGVNLLLAYACMGFMWLLRLHNAPVQIFLILRLAFELSKNLNRDENSYIQENPALSCISRHSLDYNLDHQSLIHLHKQSL